MNLCARVCTLHREIMAVVARFQIELRTMVMKLIQKQPARSGLARWNCTIAYLRRMNRCARALPL